MFRQLFFPLEPVLEILSSFPTPLWQIPPQIDPNEMSRVRRPVRDPPFLQELGRVRVSLGQPRTVHSEVVRESDWIEEEGRPEDVGRGRNLHEETGRFHRGVKLGVRLRYENSETKSVDSPIFRGRVYDVLRRASKYIRQGPLLIVSTSEFVQLTIREGLQ